MDAVANHVPADAVDDSERVGELVSESSRWLGGFVIVRVTDADLPADAVADAHADEEREKRLVGEPVGVALKERDADAHGDADRDPEFVALRMFVLDVVADCVAVHVTCLHVTCRIALLSVSETMRTPMSEGLACIDMGPCLTPEKYVSVVQRPVAVVV